MNRESMGHLDGVMFECVMSLEQKKLWKQAQEKRTKLNNHVQWALGKS